MHSISYHGVVEYCEFLGHVTTVIMVSVQFLLMPFLFSSKDPITVLCWCKTQFCSASFSVTQCWITFSVSVLSELISAEHSDQHWTDLSGPLLSPFPANLAGERGKLTLIRADQNCALADQHWSEHVGESKDLSWGQTSQREESLSGWCLPLV